MAPDVEVLVGRDVRVGQALEEPADPPEGHEQGPSTGLGRVGGEDGRDHQPVEQRRDIGRGLDPVERIGDRAVEHASSRPAGGAPERPHPMPLLGQVDELEVEGERAGQGLELVAVERRDVRRDPLLGSLAGFVVRGERAAADRDEPRAEALDEREQLGARLLGDDLAEQRAEEADLAGERVAGAADARTRGLGGYRGEASPATGSARAHAAARSEAAMSPIWAGVTRQQPPTIRAPAAIQPAAAAPSTGCREPVQCRRTGSQSSPLLG